jgi:hypothetical protein
LQKTQGWATQLQRPRNFKGKERREPETTNRRRGILASGAKAPRARATLFVAAKAATCKTMTYEAGSYKQKPTKLRARKNA